MLSSTYLVTPVHLTTLAGVFTTHLMRNNRGMSSELLPENNLPCRGDSSRIDILVDNIMSASMNYISLAVSVWPQGKQLKGLIVRKLVIKP